MMFRWLIFVLILLFLYHVREVFPPFVVGGIFAYLLIPVVNSLSTSAKIKPSLAVFIIYIIMGVVVGVACWLGGPMLVDQITNLASQHKEIVTRLVEQVSTGFNLNLDVQKTSEELLNSIEATFGKPEEIVHIGALISKSLLGILVCIVSSVYFIVDSNRVGHYFLRFVPKERRATVVQLSGQMNIMLSRYVRGQLLLIVIMSVVAYIFLSFVFHLKYALLIAIVSGFLEIIPVLGPIMAITIATVVGVAQSGISVALGIILCYWIARLAEDYIVVPKVIGHAVELHPLVVIFAVLCGEIMAGALGMLIAIPVAASIKSIVDYFYPPEHYEGLSHKQLEIEVKQELEGSADQRKNEVTAKRGATNEQYNETRDRS